MSIPRRIRRRVPNLLPIGPVVCLTASQDFWICDPLKPPEMPPFVLRFNWFGIYIYIHSQMNLHMCAKFGVNRSSRLVAFPEFVLS